jgi:hypothetical protein
MEWGGVRYQQEKEGRNQRETPLQYFWHFAHRQSDAQTKEARDEGQILQIGKHPHLGRQVPDNYDFKVERDKTR